MADALNGEVIYTVENKIATISFFHPKGNSLPSILLKEISTKIEEASEDVQVAVILLKSKGDSAFCAGASFDELLAIETLQESEKFFEGFAFLLNAMRKSEKFIVTRVQGKVVGGGVGIVAASDYVFALDKASVKLSELSIGIGPFVIAPAIERKIGLPSFSKLSMQAKTWHNSKWAREVGLFQDTFESEEDLDREVQKLLEALSSYSSKSTSALRKQFWKNTSDWNDLLFKNAKITAALALSEETKNVLEAFKTKGK